MKKESDFQYGGQAVIEGVMMRGKDYLAVAVRKPNGEIVIKKDPVGSVTKKYPVLKWPLIRGVVALCESLGVGMKALMFSADQAMEMEGEENTKLSPWETTLTIGVALLMTIALFIVLPLLGRVLIAKLVHDLVWQNVIESALRFIIFIGYIWGVSWMKDIQRVFSYHGAEHKVINAYEAKEELVVENVKKYPTFHPRCGTSFLLFVMIVSMVLFFFLPYQNLFWIHLISKILLLPVVAGVSYEVLKFVGKHQDFFLWRWLSMPGFWLQRLTTREPDDSMIEVAISSLIAVLQEESPLVIENKISIAVPVAVQAETEANGNA